MSPGSICGVHIKRTEVEGGKFEDLFAPKSENIYTCELYQRSRVRRFVRVESCEEQILKLEVCEKWSILHEGMKLMKTRGGREAQNTSHKDGRFRNKRNEAEW